MKNLIAQARIPIQTHAETNTRYNSWLLRERHRKQKMLVQQSLRVPALDRKPLLVVLTRIAPRRLDAHDNLRASLKYIADAVAEKLVPGKKVGQADSSKKILWEYAQVRGKVREYAVDIRIFETETEGGGDGG